MCWESVSVGVSEYVGGPLACWESVSVLGVSECWGSVNVCTYDINVAMAMEVAQHPLMSYKLFTSPNSANYRCQYSTRKIVRTLGTLG